MPKFSIIIPCYHSAATLGACLDSLDRQTESNWEVLLLDSSPHQSCGIVAAGRAKTRYYHHPQRLGAHAARNLAARMAAGEILVFIDPDMTADPEWLSTFNRAFEDGHIHAAGGGVDCPPGYWSCAVHLTKYGWWLPGGPDGKRPQLPSGNFSLRKQLFLDMGGFPDRFWEGDTELSYRLRARGLELSYLPKARTTHYDTPPFAAFIEERWLRGFDTGQARMARLHWHAVHRAMLVVVAPVTWVVMVARSARFAVESGWGMRWVAAAPVIGIGLAAWVAGECRALAAAP